ncbi:hypothetical protein C0J52_25082 [Blattella germanica]|nr:hypothetical protein C0J52_25082 [Blattella germanica]
MTFDESVIARVVLQIEDLRHLVFIITEVLSATILLIFLLVLVIGWRVNKDRRRQLRTSEQTFINKAYQYDEVNNRNRNMQLVYSQESQTPQDKKTDLFSVTTQNT